MSHPILLTHPSNLSPPARQALSDLARFVRHQSGGKVMRQPGLAYPHSLAIGTPPTIAPTEALAGVGHDGYALWPGEEGLLLIAHSPKGLLNAVYGYLAWHGVRWPAPGVEVLPEAGALRFPGQPIVRSPRFPDRGIYHSVRERWEAYFAWYARLGFSVVGLHMHPDNWPLLRKLGRTYGLRLEVGGHGLPDLVPRKLFSEHPEYFREPQPQDFDARRVPEYNYCATHPGTQALLKEGGARYARRYPGAEVYHLFADDLPEGGWCACPKCMGITPQDQYILALNAFARGVRSVAPAARVAYPLYHDTLEPPQLATPHPAIVPIYAPRERCYGHALDDPACARNRPFIASLQRTLDFFGRKDWLLFEYYSDYILFRAMLPLMPEVIAGDLRFYQASGFARPEHLLVGTVVGLLLNLHVFAALTWEDEVDPWAALQRLAGDCSALLDAWKLRAEASRCWLQICDFPLERYFDYRFLIELPTEKAEAYRAQLQQAASLLEQACHALPRRLPAWARGERLSLATSLAIVKQMASQMAMLQAVGECYAGKHRWAAAKSAYRATLRHGKKVARLFEQAGMHDAYFFRLERMLEEMWRVKVGEESATTDLVEAR